MGDLPSVFCSFDRETVQSPPLFSVVLLSLWDTLCETPSRCCPSFSQLFTSKVFHTLFLFASSSWTSFLCVDSFSCPSLSLSLTHDDDGLHLNCRHRHPSHVLREHASSIQYRFLSFSFFALSFKNGSNDREDVVQHERPAQLTKYISRKSQERWY